MCFFFVAALLFWLRNSVEMIENIVDLFISHINLQMIHVLIDQETDQSQNVWKIIMN